MYNLMQGLLEVDRHVQIKVGWRIGHDARTGKNAILVSGIHVSGGVHIGERASIGTGSVIIDGNRHEPVVVSEDAFVGAGASAMKYVPVGTTVVRLPTRSR
jgi:UDP-3-O-[3-hydroxymyristoyl] glucosamine N-acyltransferase